MSFDRRDERVDRVWFDDGQTWRFGSDRTPRGAYVGSRSGRGPDDLDVGRDDLLR